MGRNFLIILLVTIVFFSCASTSEESGNSSTQYPSRESPEASELNGNSSQERAPEEESGDDQSYTSQEQQFLEGLDAESYGLFRINRDFQVFINPGRYWRFYDNRDPFPEQLKYLVPISEDSSVSFLGIGFTRSSRYFRILCDSTDKPLDEYFTMLKYLNRDQITVEREWQGLVQGRDTKYWIYAAGNLFFYEGVFDLDGCKIRISYWCEDDDFTEQDPVLQELFDSIEIIGSGVR